VSERQTSTETSDALKQVPDQLEALIGEKKYLRAALLLVKNSRTINRPDFAGIGALSDLKVYFAGQQSVSRP
jgi:exocyst complex component 4